MSEPAVTERAEGEADAKEATAKIVAEQARAQALRLIEALLFAAAEPLSEEALASHLAEGTDVESLVVELAEIYKNRGVNLLRIGGGWVFRTAADLAPRLMLERVVTRKMSRAAVETLAIIAYHQPVTRGEVEEIRGVALSRGILDTLMESGWIRPKGHKQTPGRPAMWVTTPEFLTHFGLEALSDLPGIDELKAAGLLDARPSTSLGEVIGGQPQEGEEGVDALDEDPLSEAEAPE
jgi:segregation and condensation protein B